MNALFSQQVTNLTQVTTIDGSAGPDEPDKTTLIVVPSHLVGNWYELPVLAWSKQFLTRPGWPR